MKDREHQIQVECVRWFRMQYPSHLIFAIPNGGQRNVIVASKMKAEGVTAGIPDLCVATSKDCYNGLFIEMKNGSQGRLSDKQKAIIELLEREGYKCVVCRNFDEFFTEVNTYMKNGK